MKASLPICFKIVFLAGITLLFVSLFVDWYLFQVFDNGILVASWEYNILFEWTTKFPSGITVNESHRPGNLNIPLAVHFLFIGLIIFTVYTVFFKDLERSENLIGLKSYSLGFLILLVLILFYIVIFPVAYLFPNELYFPSLLDNNIDLAMEFSYSISYGYVLQLVGFLLVFPYSLHYYHTITSFEKQENTDERKIASYIEGVQESVDLDRYIAEEESLS